MPRAFRSSGSMYPVIIIGLLYLHHPNSPDVKVVNSSSLCTRFDLPLSPLHPQVVRIVRGKEGWLQAKALQASPDAHSPRHRAVPPLPSIGYPGEHEERQHHCHDGAPGDAVGEAPCLS